MKEKLTYKYHVKSRRSKLGRWMIELNPEGESTLTQVKIDSLQPKFERKQVTLSQ